MVYINRGQWLKSEELAHHYLSLIISAHLAGLASHVKHSSFLVFFCLRCLSAGSTTATSFSGPHRKPMSFACAVSWAPQSGLVCSNR